MINNRYFLSIVTLEFFPMIGFPCKEVTKTEFDALGEHIEATIEYEALPGPGALIVGCFWRPNRQSLDLLGEELARKLQREVPNEQYTPPASKTDLN
jgi:hypothetical protein